MKKDRDSSDNLDEEVDATSTYEPFAEISKTLLERAKGSRKPRQGARVSAGDGLPHAVDVYVGGQLKKLRGRRQLSQQALADRLGLTFQQVQKYEGGKNRLSASRMYEISVHLGVTPAYFFDGIDPKLDQVIGQETGALGEVQERYLPDEDIMAKTESIRMMAAFYSIPDQNIRLALRMLVSKVAKSLGHNVTETDLSEDMQ